MNIRFDYHNNKNGNYYEEVLIFADNKKIVKHEMLLQKTWY